MTQIEKDKIKEKADTLSNKDLMEWYQNSIFGCLGGISETMLDNGMAIEDVIAIERAERYISEEADFLYELCRERGIEPWEEW